jgi:A/G-specific adenine glycosylase
MFSKKLIAWYKINKRELPWRETTDAYKVWLSEIILQQTRVLQGLPYYNKFVSSYPTVRDLANASEDQVLRLWQGLGYYSRGRNLHFTAKYVSEQLNGVFPNSFSELRKLKGVGDYTAAAIASFCYKEKVPVVDGNVLRVISRLKAISDPIDSLKVKKEIFNASLALIDNEEPDIYNQAIMELGATVCMPKNPSCSDCPVSLYCEGLKIEVQNKIPYKAKKIKVRQRKISYLVFSFESLFALKKRGPNDIWENLYDFYEMPEGEIDVNQYLKLRYNLIEFEDFRIINKSEKSHVLSHQKLSIDLYLIELKTKLEIEGLDFFSYNEVDYLPKPILIQNYLKEI